METAVGVPGVVISPPLRELIRKMNRLQHAYGLTRTEVLDLPVAEGTMMLEDLIPTKLPQKTQAQHDWDRLTGGA